MQKHQDHEDGMLCELGSNGAAPDERFHFEGQENGDIIISEVP